MKKLIIISLLLSCLSSGLWAQELTQVVRGRVIDATSEVPLIGATVLLVGTDPAMGQITDVKGAFVIHDVPLGRYTVQASYTMIWHR